MTANNKITAATLAGAVAAAMSLLAVQASAAEDQAGKEKCYGVSLKNHNDCAAGAGTSCAGTAKVDYDPGAWKYVAKGTCQTIKTPKGTGSLTPTKS